MIQTTILALVLAGGAVALWSTQRVFLIESASTQLIAEVSPLIPEQFDVKLAAELFPTMPLDQEILQTISPKLIAILFPAGEDPRVTRKRLYVLNPELADALYPDGSTRTLSKAEVEAIVPKLLAGLFGLDKDFAQTRKKLIELDPELAAQISLGLQANQQYQQQIQAFATKLAVSIAGKNRGVMVFALDGSLLSNTGEKLACPRLAVDGALVKRLNFNRSYTAISEEQLNVFLPVPSREPIAIIQVCSSTAALDTTLRQLGLSLVAGWVLVVGLATLLGVTATRRVLRPLDQVVATTRRIAAGDLQQRVGLQGQTEIAQLGTAFDAMVERLEASFIAQRRFVADAAHELRTPLTALSTSVELLLIGATGDDPATMRRLLRHLDSELGRVIRLTNDLLTLSRLDASPTIELCPIDLSALLEMAGESSRILLHDQEFTLEVASGLSIRGDADRLQQVFVNLFDNARKYTPPGGRIILRAYAAPEQESVVVELEDSGIGIPAESLPHLFERFYRVDGARSRAGGGSGLGLAIVQAIIQAHGGHVCIQSAPGSGTCITIRLPGCVAQS